MSSQGINCKGHYAELGWWLQEGSREEEKKALRIKIIGKVMIMSIQSLRVGGL
jgi:hypothetical protein